MPASIPEGITLQYVDGLHKHEDGLPTDFPMRRVAVDEGCRSNSGKNIGSCMIEIVTTNSKFKTTSGQSSICHVVNLDLESAKVVEDQQQKLSTVAYFIKLDSDDTPKCIAADASVDSPALPNLEQDGKNELMSDLGYIASSAETNNDGNSNFAVLVLPENDFILEELTFN